MSEKLFSFLLSELERVRIRCKCGKIVDMPITDLTGAFGAGNNNCRFCGADYTHTIGEPATLKKFADAVAELKRLSDAKTFEVEFCIPDSN